MADTDSLYQEINEDVMNILISGIQSILSFIKEEFDLDPAGLWLR